MAPSRALEAIWKLVREANRYVDATQPWALAKDPAKRAELAHVLHNLANAIGVIGGLVAPVLPTTGRDAARVGRRRPAPSSTAWPSRERHAADVVGDVAKDAEAAVPAARRRGAGRRSSTQIVPATTPRAAPAGKAAPRRAAAAATAAARSPTTTSPSSSCASARCSPAVRCPKKDKLLHLTVDLGEAKPRSIVAGIAQAYKPEQLVGKQVIVVANLAPREARPASMSRGHDPRRRRRGDPRTFRARPRRPAGNAGTIGDACRSIRRAPRLVVNAPAVVESIGQAPMQLHPNLAQVFRRVDADRSTIGTKFPAVVRDLSTNGAFISGAPLPLLVARRAQVRRQAASARSTRSAGCCGSARTTASCRAAGAARTLPKGFGVLFEAIPLETRAAIAALVSAIAVAEHAAFRFRPRYRGLAWSAIGVGGALGVGRDRRARRGAAAARDRRARRRARRGATCCRRRGGSRSSIDDDALEVRTPKATQFRLAWSDVVRVVASPRRTPASSTAARPSAACSCPATARRRRTTSRTRPRSTTRSSRTSLRAKVDDRRDAREPRGARTVREPDAAMPALLGCAPCRSCSRARRSRSTPRCATSRAAARARAAMAAHALGDVTEPREAARGRRADPRARRRSPRGPRRGVRSLGELGEPGAVPHARQAARRRRAAGPPERGDRARHAAATPTAFEPLAEALREGPADLRFQAATSLAEIDRDARVRAARRRARRPRSAGRRRRGAVARRDRRRARDRALLAAASSTTPTPATRFDVAYALAELGDRARPRRARRRARRRRARVGRGHRARRARRADDAERSAARSPTRRRRPRRTVLAAGTLLALAPTARTTTPRARVLLDALDRAQGPRPRRSRSSSSPRSAARGRRRRSRSSRARGKGVDLLEAIAGALRAIEERRSR